MTHIRVLAMAAVLTGGLGLTTTTQAAPFSVAPLAGGAIIEQVAGGCGPGFHPTPWGVCRPNWGGPRPYWQPRPYYGGGYGYYRPRPIYRPYGFYGPRPFF